MQMANNLPDLIVRAVYELDKRGLNRGSSGNCSARINDTSFLITPSGIASAEVTSDLLVLVQLNTESEPALHEWQGRTYRASSEWRFHRDIYRSRPDVNSIVHVHSTFATALACARRGIPAFHYMVAIAGGADIRCAKYATYGTQELSDSVILALRDRTACLVENHGMIAIGSTTSTAVATAIEVEALAQQYLLSMVVGGPELLSIEQMTAVLSKFAEYKQLKGTT